MENKIDQIYAQLQKGDRHLPIIFNIVYEASRFFEKCPQDFCLQNEGDTTIIFGGVNRLVWRVSTGFRVDPSHCTAEFTAHAKTLR